MLRKFILAILFLFLTQLSSVAIEKLHFKGFIADEANVLSEDVKEDLNMTLWDLQKKSGADIAVVTVNSLGGMTVEDYALDIGTSYKLGAVGKNNGVVFLTAIDERQLRFELGLGLESKIPISSLNQIMKNDVIPYYRQEEYEKGIARGTYKLAELVAAAEGVEIVPQGECPPQTYSNTSKKKSERAPLWVYMMAAFLSVLFPRRRRFSSSGFGGFGGGGGFGGSGCSGSW